MIGCLRTRVRKQPIIALYFEFETVLKFYNLEAWPSKSIYRNVVYTTVYPHGLYSLLEYLINQ